MVQCRLGVACLLCILWCGAAQTQDVVTSHVEREKESNAYLALLDQKFPHRIDEIRVTTDRLIVSATIGGNRDEMQSVGLVERPMFLSRTARMGDEFKLEASGKHAPGLVIFDIKRFDGLRDRATSRFEMVDLETKEVVSSCSYVTAYDSGVQRLLEKTVSRGIKGIGAMPPGLHPQDELLQLDVQHATVNVVLNSIISDQEVVGWTSWEFEGKQFWINEALLVQYDQTMRVLFSEKIVVSLILLVGNPRDPDGSPASTMVHPEALSSGIFVMPNLVTPEGVSLYRASIALLADRYCGEDHLNGRITNWILHNEVDQAGTWTNMGEQPMARFVETYQRSARIVHQTVRLFDPHARVFISLTHHWTKQSPGAQTYVVRELLDLFNKAAKSEGDFEWGVAYHPYPEPMTRPEVWKDEVTYDFNTKYITPKNIEVLTAYLAQERFEFNGQPRAIMLTEQGIDSKTLSNENQSLQAAGVLYTMTRVRQLPVIEAFHYHGHTDAPGVEGGLRIGLRAEPHVFKKAWGLYRDWGTEREAEASSGYWSLLGVEGAEGLGLETVLEANSSPSTK